MSDISEKRVQGSTRRMNLQKFQRLCGKKSLKSVVLVTTQWDTVPFALGEARETELMESFWADLVKGGAVAKRVRRDDPDTHMDVLGHILECAKEDHANTRPLTIQKEYVDQSKRIPLTQAGQKLKYSLAELRQIQETAVEDAPTEERREDLKRRLKARLSQMKVSFMDRVRAVSRLVLSRFTRK